WFAYGLNTSGSDWNSLRIKNVDTGNDLPEVLTRLKFSNITWTHDNRGFFYSAFPGIEGDGTETTECTYQKLYYHRIGTPQTEDVLVYERPDEPNYRFNASISDCGHYLHVWTNHSCEYNLWHYHRFADPLAPVITGPLALETVVDVFNADYYYVANDGPRTVFRTNLHASNFRLCVVDLSDVAAARLPASWTDLVPEHPKDVLEGAVAAAGDLIVASYIRDVTSRVQLHRLADGSLLRELPLPLGNVTGLAAKREQKELFYSFTSFLIPGIVYHLVLEGEGVTGAKEPTVFREAKPANFDHTKFVTEQVFYESKDGTKVPMFLVHKKDFTKDGQAPCRLYAYGGFNVSIKPSFSLQNIILMENLGGLFALANIRGGGEYGEKWHNAAKLEKKQTCFDDFIAAAEYLTKERYTRSEKLWIEGGSNGGLLIGAVSNQRPELFAAGIAHVGVMDLLRFHKFTIGHAWMSEYGNPEKEADFRNLIRLSPLHNVPGDVDRFPATLLLTADHDDRVVPLHSFKLIAELQHKLGEKVGARTPLLARIDTKSGHGFGKPTEKIIEEVADIYSFIINALKLEYKQQQ
ncbi:PREDICTED: prolyl endopeptidase-like, partial [Rhagoletis zephyria]|uniref:prolyl endopeptidase-like n=1 Tax=Rhagoletis zephyria TaxID=28612 RepID=UPI000811A4B4